MTMTVEPGIPEDDDKLDVEETAAETTEQPEEQLEEQLEEQSEPQPVEPVDDYDEADTSVPQEADDDTPGDVDGAIDPEHLRLLEAVIFASATALNERQMVNRLPDGANLKGLLKALRDSYESRGVNLVKAGACWGFRTAPDVAQALTKEQDVTRKLSRAAIETIAIIAYHQPVTRAEIEEIRGVSISKGTLDVLFEASWIKPRGRRQTPGRPMTWGTTDGFLDHFGLESLKDLPGVEELRAAGLLDARPAIDAYSVRGTVADKAKVTTELPDTPDSADATEELVSEPMDPEGDDQA